MKLVRGKTVYFLSGKYIETDKSNLKLTKGKINYISKDFPFLAVESDNGDEILLHTINVHESINDLLNSIGGIEKV